MGHSQIGKAENRARILEEAAALIREEGLDGVSIARLMERVGLTAGGFYKHFASRDELLGIVLDKALTEGHAASVAAIGEGQIDVAMIVRSYLSRSHRENLGGGCAIAALAGETGRAGDGIREIMSTHIENFVSCMRTVLEDKDDKRAIVAVCAMVGAVSLSRAMSDVPRSDEVLRTVRDFLIAQLEA